MTPEEKREYLEGKAVIEGSSAFNEGKTRLANPYDSDLTMDKLLHDMWDFGWYIAQRKQTSGKGYPKDSG